jgi:nicotinamide riboside transporter PnuC
MTTDLHEGPLEAAPVITPAKPSWREQRRNRRRRRVWFEEILGWILVPVIVVGGYWLVIVALNAVGTSPSAIIDGLTNITSNL